MVHSIRILLVEDSESDADLLVRFLKKENVHFTHTRVWERNSYIKALKDSQYDIIISDQNLPQFSGMEAFSISKSLNIPFIMVTGAVSEIFLTEFAKEGIDDYILKENLLRLPTAIENVINKRKIEALHKNLEIAHKNIKDSINYAKTIQNAMLPDTQLLSKNLPHSFILFKPKDTLSGDFYWFKKEDDTLYIAAADCTGHGIPGALMSMVGIEKLNNAISLTKNPGEILNELNKSIEIALCQSTKYEHSQDGMDIALCSINKKTGVLNFAGANRPIWIIRNGCQEVEEIKGTKKAIGGTPSEHEFTFINNEIVLKKGDAFYLSTDGYADQFGGKIGKKLMTKRFKEILIEIQSKPMAEQKVYLGQFIENWRAEIEQVDDILVIGVRQEE